MDFLANLANNYAEAPAQEQSPEPEPPPPIPPFFIPLFEATQAMLAGEIDHDDWMDIWEKVGLTLHSTIQNIEKQLKRTGRAMGRGAEIKLIGQGLKDGLHQAFEALDEMGEYLDDGEEHHLETGWVDLLEASQTIARATTLLQKLRERLKPE
jgi:hypothetical protein